MQIHFDKKAENQFYAKNKICDLPMFQVCILHDFSIQCITGVCFCEQLDKNGARKKEKIDFKIKNWTPVYCKISNVCYITGTLSA